MHVLGSRRWRWKAGKTPEGLREIANYQLDTCPAGCYQDELRGGSARIVRSSPRSITMACRRCGLQWTMTMHQLAKAAPHWKWETIWLGDDAPEEGPKYLAEIAMPETRGRKSKTETDQP